MNRRLQDNGIATLDDNPQWYKDAVIYEIHVRAFCDGNGDGIGDFVGLTEKLDYLQDLGVTALWLLPFYPSPLSDDGYDIADYTSIHRDLRHAARFQDVLARSAPALDSRDHRAGHQSYVRPTPLVSARARSQTGQRGAQFLRLERQPGQVSRGAHHFQRFRAVQLDLGPGGQGLLLASFLLRTSPISISTIRRCKRRSSLSWISGLIWASTACVWTPCPISTSATAPTAKIFRKPMRF